MSIIELYEMSIGISREVLIPRNLKLGRVIFLRFLAPIPSNNYDGTQIFDQRFDVYAASNICPFERSEVKKIDRLIIRYCN